MNDSTPQDPAPATARKRRKWPTIVALTLAVIALLTIILLPVGIQYGLRDWLLQNGAQDVRIGDVDLNLFTGTLQVENIRIDVDERNTLRADLLALNFDWQALVKEHLTLTSLQLSGIDVEIAKSENGELHIGGILIPGGDTSAEEKLDKLEQGIEDLKSKDKKESNWKLGIDSLHFADIGIRYSMPKLKVDTHIKQLSLKNLAAWAPEKSAQITLQATINGAALDYQGGIAPFASPMHVDGHIALSKLALNDFAQIAAVADELKGKLSLQSDIDLNLGDAGIDAQIKAENIQLEDLLFSTADMQLQQKSLSWRGDIAIQQADTVHLVATGNIASEQLALSLSSKKLDIDQESFKTTVNVELTSDDKKGSPSIIAQVSDTAISQLHMSANKFPVTGVEQLAIDTLELHDAGTLDIQKIQLEKLYVARAATEEPQADKAPTALFNNGSLVIEKLSLKNANALSIDNILLKNADIHLSSDSDGKTNLDALLAAINSITEKETTATNAGTQTESNKPSANTEATTDAEPARFHIGHIQVSDDSTIIIDDASTMPPTRIDISIESLSVDNLDNSSPNEVTKLAAKGKFGRFGSYTLSGEAKPFSEKTNAKLVADIKGVDLPRLSPYTARDLDFRLRSGTLASDIDMAITENKLSGKIKLVLHQLELIPLTEKKKGGEITATSLNTSLNMLRDKNNTITLNIPLSGDINAPDFSIQNAINQALMSGVKTGVMTYALLALQPYGTMVVVAKYAGEQISKLRLDPVKFAPGSSEIDATARDYLGKVASILIDRPKVDIKVCGVATASDAAALSGSAKDKPPASDKASLKKLKELARQRSIAVREFLISKSGKAGHQLIGCMPMVEDNADALPRADLLI